MESRNRLRIVGRRYGKSISKCPSLVYCRALPVYENRVRAAFECQPEDRGFCSHLVEYSNFPGGGRGNPYHAKPDRPSVLSRDLWSSAQFHFACWRGRR